MTASIIKMNIKSKYIVAMENEQTITPDEINVEFKITDIIVDRKNDRTINCLNSYFLPLDTSKMSIKPGAR